MHSPRAILLALALLLMLGCAQTPHSTRLTVDDFNEMAGQMAQSLLASDALAQRTADSPPWFVSMQKMTNLSSDVMTDAEQWSIMADLRSSTPILDLREMKNVRFILPYERLQAMRHTDSDFAEDLPENFAYDRHVTHTLTAVIHSLVRADQVGRTDLYYAEFQLYDLNTGQPVWIDRFEFQRQARGHLWN